MGLWIVLSQLVRIPGNSLQDLSGYPLITVVPFLIMASLVSASAEEIGFRGYLQGPLESRLGAVRRPQLAEPRDHAHALVAGMVEGAPAR